LARNCHWHLIGPRAPSNASGSTEGAKAIVIVMQVTDIGSAQQVVDDLVSREEDLPLVCALLTKVGEVEDMTKILDVQKELLAMGIEDVICNSRTKQEVHLAIAMALVRAQDRAEVIRGIEEDVQKRCETEMRGKIEEMEAKLPEPKMGFFWQAAHRTFDGFPRLDRRLTQQPAPGARVGPFEVGSQLGRGRFGTVFAVRDARTGRKEAMKVVQKDRFEEVEAVAALWREMYYLNKLDHQNVVRLAGSLHGPSHIFVRLEHAGRCNLFRALRVADGPLALGAAKDYFAQLVSGVAHCHSRDIAHRDIKPENITITEDSQHIKLVDFGAASCCSKLRGELVGTMPFMPPEVMAVTGGVAYRPSGADIWSSAVVLLEMMGGIDMLSKLLGWGRCIQPCADRCYELKALFHERPKAIAEALEEHLGEVSDDLQKLLSGMLELDPDDRWPAMQVDGSPWVLACRRSR